MASSEKRCLYEVLGLRLDCTADEIRSAYKKLALQRHPDKLIQSGVSQSDATASFQELVNAYEVLTDPRERAWYDSHRSQILFSNSNPSSNSPTSIPNLFTFFSNSVFSGYSDSGKGFYKVYGDVFDRIYQNELNFATKLGLGLPREMPLMGNLESLYSQVNAFYGYWLGFVTVMDFVWVDQYDAMAGPNRKSRRVMEEENKKMRKKARREYNETVRGLAEFVKKRDKRVIDMQVKRNEEMERKREEEKERKRRMDRERAERVRVYEEPEWAKVEEVEDGEEVEEDGERRKELYCVVCGKKFKSEKQWKNHEQSKKHKEKVAELREAMSDEESENEEGEEEEEGRKEEENGFLSADDAVDELREQFENGVGIRDREHNDDDDDDGQFSEEESFVDIDNVGGLKGVGEKLGSEDDEASILDAMVSGHKSRKNVGTTRKAKASSTKVNVEVDSDEMEFMEYNNRKGSGRNKGGRRERGKRADEAAEKVDVAEISNRAEENSGHDDGSHPKETRNKGGKREKGKRADEAAERVDAAEINSQAEENSERDDASHAMETSSSHSFAENETNDGVDDRSGRSRKVPKQTVDKNSTTKKHTNTKSKNASKGRKQKATSKTSDHACDTCGEDFESRNKLHKHLSDTGHAKLKSR